MNYNQTKSRKLILKMFLSFNVFLIFLSFEFGCQQTTGTGTGNGTTGTNCDSQTKKYLKISKLYKDPFVTNSNKYYISFLGCFTSSNQLNIRLQIIGDYNSNCTALENDNFEIILSGQETFPEKWFSLDYFTPFCNSTNKYYTIYAYVEDGDTVRASEPALISFGSPFAYSAKVNIEYDYIASFDYWNIDSTKKSFTSFTQSYWTTDIGKYQYSDVINNSPVFTATSINDLMNQLNGYTGSYRCTDTNNYPIYLNISYLASIPNIPFLGISNSKLYDGTRRNYSFVFTKNHEIRYGISFNQNTNYRKSTLSYNITHELLRQVAVLMYPGAYNDHDRDSCVINNSYTYYDDTFFNFGRMSWIICPKHFTWLKASPYTINSGNNNSINTGGLSQTYFSNENDSAIQQTQSELKLSLQKYSYKKYEPILALLKYTNQSSKNDTVIDMFEEFSDNLSFKIIPLDGQIYKKAKFGFSINSYPIPYSVKPFDSLKLSFDINKYGNKFLNTENYFDMLGYFNPGRYKVYASGKNKNVQILSDTLEFKVIELSEEDSIVLNLLGQNHYSDILQNFQENPFRESIYFYSAHTQYRPKIKDFSYSKNDVLNLYRETCENYGESYYWFKPAFVLFMFDKLALFFDSIDSEIEKIRNTYNCTYLNEFLNQESVIKRIKIFDKDRRNVIKESKKNKNIYDYSR